MRAQRTTRRAAAARLSPPACARALAALLPLSACTKEPAPPAPAPPAAASPRIDEARAALLQRLDPLPADGAQDPVLVAAGIPIRRGDFQRILDHWLPTLRPDQAEEPLLELALVNELLPRALALSVVPLEDLERIASSYERRSAGAAAFELEELAADWAPASARRPDPAEVWELQVERKRNSQPFLARAGSLLDRPGARTPPIVTRAGVFVLERVDPTAAVGPPGTLSPDATRAALWVRSVALEWRLSDPDQPVAFLVGPGAAAWIDARMREQIRGRKIDVLDPRYAVAVPAWMP